MVSFMFSLILVSVYGAGMFGRSTRIYIVEMSGSCFDALFADFC